MEKELTTHVQQISATQQQVARKARAASLIAAPAVAGALGGRGSLCSSSSADQRFRISTASESRTEQR